MNAILSRVYMLTSRTGCMLGIKRSQSQINKLFRLVIRANRMACGTRAYHFTHCRPDYLLRRELLLIYNHHLFFGGVCLCLLREPQVAGWSADHALNWNCWSRDFGLSVSGFRFRIWSSTSHNYSGKATAVGALFRSFTRFLSVHYFIKFYLLLLPLHRTADSRQLWVFRVACKDDEKLRVSGGWIIWHLIATKRVDPETICFPLEIWEYFHSPALNCRN